MTENIRGKREADIICDEFDNVDNVIPMTYNHSTPTADEIISEIQKWADSIPSFLGAEMYQPSEESILLGLGIDKDFSSDKIGIRALSDSMPLCIKPSFLTLGFYA